jgi:L-fuconolactonase
LVIDAHHHFWNYEPVEYGWISDRMSVLRRNFDQWDLAREMEAADVNGAVSVQARQTIEETFWLLEIAAMNDFILGVVGWVPLAEPDIAERLECLEDVPKLKGVRHVVQDEPDDDFILRDDFNRGVAALGRFKLAYDILIFERHLPQTIRFVDRHPDQVFVLDHVAKPRVREGIFDPWRQNLCTLARRPNVYCKLSGVVTEADHGAWTPAQLRPYFDAALEAFGPSRLMFGSDWPVCLLASGYGRWMQTVREWAATAMSPAEQARFFGGTAAEAYQL